MPGWLIAVFVGLMTIIAVDMQVAPEARKNKLAAALFVLMVAFLAAVHVMGAGGNPT